MGKKESFEVFLKKDNKELYYWFKNQQMRKSQLSPDRIKKLESLSNFSWPKNLNTLWQEKYNECKKFITKTEELPTYNSMSLYDWLRYQKKNKDKLTNEQISLLEELPGFAWEIVNYNDIWQENYSECKKFITKTNKLPIRKSNKSLCGWLYLQKINKDNLTDEQTSLLEIMPGFTWDIKCKLNWQERYDEYKKFIEEIGKLPTSKSNKLLYYWLYQQKLKKDKLTDKQIALLEELPGFTWEIVNYNDIWQEKYRECKKFIAETGESPSLKSNKPLYQWLWYQKSKKSKLTNEQIALLEMLPGFRWGK